MNNVIIVIVDIVVILVRGVYAGLRVRVVLVGIVLTADIVDIYIWYSC